MTLISQLTLNHITVVILVTIDIDNGHQAWEMENDICVQCKYKCGPTVFEATTSVMTPNHKRRYRGSSAEDGFLFLVKVYERLFSLFQCPWWCNSHSSTGVFH